jgi:hypothetical protein
MRATFRHYFRPTEEELQGIWDVGLFAFDASVLLNIYGYSKKTREDVVNFIEANADRVRLPYQFGLEYVRNRNGVIIKQLKNCQKVREELERIWKNSIAAKSGHPYLSKKAAGAYQVVLKELDESRKVMEKWIGSDPFLEKNLTVFEGKVGKCPTEARLAELCSEAQERYDRLVPPGFADMKVKEKPDMYGDYIAWREIMDISAEEKSDIILVIDDAKEDWWLLERGRTLGPRPELLEEFARVTGQRFWMYTSESFMRAAKQYASANIGEEAIEEVTESLENRRVASELKSSPPDTPPLVLPNTVTVGAEKATEFKGTARADFDNDGPKKTEPGIG